MSSEDVFVQMSSYPNLTNPSKSTDELLPQKPLSCNIEVSKDSPSNDGKPSQPEGVNTTFGVTLNLINTMIGAGILAISGMFRDAGLIPGLIILTGMGIMLAFSAWLLGCLCEDSGVSGSWDRLFEHYFGRKWGWITETLTLLFVYGACLSYSVLLKTFLKKLLQKFCYTKGGFVWDPESIGELPGTLPTGNWVVVPIVALMLICISMIDKKHLSFTSFFGIVAITATCLIIVYDYISPEESVPNAATSTIEYWSSSRSSTLTGLVKAMCISGFAYATHFNVPMVYGQLIDRSPEKFSISVGSSFLACIILYDVIGTLGYLRFGSAMKEGEYILNFPSDYGWPIVTARIGMFISIFTGFPLYINPLRIALNSLLVRLGFLKEEPTEWDFSQRMTTIVLIILAVLPTLFEVKVETVLQFAVAISGSWIILGLPGLMGLQMTKGKKKPLIRALSLLLLISGALLCVLGIWSSVNDILEPKKNVPIIPGGSTNPNQ